MTPVDWAALTHAYGSASDVPGLLARAADAPAPRAYNDEPWFSLWSSLCHQGTVYPASYAAVPELVRLAEQRDGDARAECLLLAASIEMERHSRWAPPIPDVLAADYSAALQEGAALAVVELGAAWGTGDLPRRLQVAAAALSGNLEAARTLAGEDSEGDEEEEDA
jgi:hypothetical protein